MQHGQPRHDDIDVRALLFVRRVFHFVGMPPVRLGSIADQLVGAAGGIGSNLEEARAAATRREFLRFNEIALRESLQSRFWLRVCQQTGLGNQPACGDLIDEAQQIATIIAAIIINTKKDGL